MIAGQLGPGKDVVPEEAAVIDHPRDHLDLGRAAAPRQSSPGHGSRGLRMIIAQSIRSPKRSRQAIRSRVKPFAGPGATPITPVRPVVAQRRHRVPDRLARVAGAVGVVKQQQVEAVGADPLQAALGRRPQVVGVLGGPRSAGR